MNIACIRYCAAARGGETRRRIIILSSLATTTTPAVGTRRHTSLASPSRLVGASSLSLSSSSSLFVIRSFHDSTQRQDDDAPSSSSSSSWYHEFDNQAYAARRQEFEQRLQRNSNNNNDSVNHPSSSQHGYTRDTDADTSLVNVSIVHQLLAKRAAARARQDYGQADQYLTELRHQHGVVVNDVALTWRSGYRPPSVRRQQQQQQGNDQNQSDPKTASSSSSSSSSTSPYGHDYMLCPTAGPNQSGWTENKIHDYMAARTQARIKRQWATADNLQAQLAAVGVYMQDEIKQWRADGQRFPRNAALLWYGSSDGTTTSTSSTSSTTKTMHHRTMADNRPYRRAALSPPTPHDAAIQALVDQRAQAKKDRNYAQADTIRKELVEKYNVHIQDALRKWCIGRMPTKED